MSYKVTIHRAIRKRIVAWNLPDPVFVEVLLRLEQELGRSPWQHLVRLRKPFDGLCYLFTLVDPTNRFREYAFYFQVEYGQDEETLHIVNCYHVMSGL